jgi:RimJ/RimL family protein N-acetyltransferase
MSSNDGQVDTDDLFLEWSEAVWDTKVFGFPVLQIGRLELRGSRAERDVAIFERARDEIGSGMVSCRLSHQSLRESIMLENHGFRFIEMVYLPELELNPNVLFPEPTLSISPAREKDMPRVLEIAGTAFRNERFHVDPRLDPALGDQRYRNWVADSLHHPQQRLDILRDGRRLVAFFVSERFTDGTYYWHLNAVAPEAQGKGYGRRAWVEMLRLAQSEGAKRVRTCIVARNYRVLNLYARLGFHFPPPLMTFHWLKSAFA